MWGDREALAPLSLADRQLVVEVGCGSGEFTRVLTAETNGQVMGVDVDRTLLDEAPVETIQGDATALPIATARADLVVCQALLVNLLEPPAALTEFRRVSDDLVAAVEPNNAAVTIESTVSAEERLAARARTHYIAGIATDPTMGAVPDLFREAGLSDVRTRRYEHEQVLEPPYSEAAVAAARRRATGRQLASQREVLLAGGMSPEAYEEFREAWRSMGRTVVQRMDQGTYRRREVVPFHLTVGRV